MNHFIISCSNDRDFLNSSIERWLYTGVIYPEDLKWLQISVIYFKLTLNCLPSWRLKAILKYENDCDFTQGIKMNQFLSG